MSLCLVLVHAVCHCWPKASFDVIVAYQYSLVKETVFVEPHLKGKALRLKKALYGMKQVGQSWWIFLSEILTRMGFTAMEVEQSLYIFRSGETTVAIWIHVNNGVVTLSSQASISEFKQRLCAEAEIKWHDTVAQIVGLECAIGEGEVAIAQQRLTNSMIEAYPQTIIKTDSPLSQGLLWKQEGLALRNQELTWRAPKDKKNNKD
ncbi:hypothetical protein O181_087462 [Austropuccinia psidii MF-1]|uniref:Reverse transcriptase Ty1/copia-type domain-containing protein n=1 Tax=Austropuccinia psidii MF-1 TaxID=1389203 RepID=A0A9Q3P375_9BASI|nr:hypothetical protein [Austropuccinia psidii MF-1]